MNRLSINTVEVITVNSAEQVRRIDEVIARRAYEIFERRGGTGWHGLHDWRQAESEVRSNLCFSIMSSHDSLHIGFNAAGFEGGSVALWVAPRQLTICGKPFQRKEPASGAGSSYKGIVYCVITLPQEIDPHRAGVNVKRNFVEVRLPMVVQKCQERRAA
jgi:HSP20 family molecular chaperone IbpA